MQGCLVIQNKNPSYQFGKPELLLCSTDTLLVSYFLLMLLILKLLGQQQLQQGRRGLEEVGDQGRYPQFLRSAVLAGTVGPRVTLEDRSTWHYAFSCSGLFPSQFLTGLCVSSHF